MTDEKQKVPSKQKRKTVATVATVANETTTDPHNKLLDALSGFEGWSLPPLNHRADTSNRR